MKKASASCQEGPFGPNNDLLFSDLRMSSRIPGQAQELKLFSHSAPQSHGRRLLLVAQQACARSQAKAAFPAAIAAASLCPGCSSGSHYASSISGYQLSQFLIADPYSQISFQSVDPESDCQFFHDGE